MSYCLDSFELEECSKNGCVCLQRRRLVTLTGVPVQCSDRPAFSASASAIRSVHRFSRLKRNVSFRTHRSAQVGILSKAANRSLYPVFSPSLLTLRNRHNRGYASYRPWFWGNNSEEPAPRQALGCEWTCFRAGRECVPTFLRTSLAKGPLS